MSIQTLSLDVPGPLYARYEKLAQTTNRSVQAEMLDALAVAAPEELDPDEIAASLRLLDEPTLWRAARAHLSTEVAEQIEELHFKKQRTGLGETEKVTLAGLMRQYHRALLIRANAAAILKERGGDVSVLLKP